MAEIDWELERELAEWFVDMAQGRHPYPAKGVPTAEEIGNWRAKQVISLVRQHIEPEEGYEERVEIDEDGNIVKVEPQPDRLLTPEEIENAVGISLPKHSRGYMEALGFGISLNQLQTLRRKQDAKTASIKDAEIEAYRDRIASLVEEVTRLLDLSSQMNEALKTKDAESQVRVERIFKEIELANINLSVRDEGLNTINVRLNSREWWQALKDKELKQEGRG